MGALSMPAKYQGYLAGTCTTLCSHSVRSALTPSSFEKALVTFHCWVREVASLIQAYHACSRVEREAQDERGRLASGPGAKEDSPSMSENRCSECAAKPSRVTYPALQAWKVAPRQQAHRKKSGAPALTRDTLARRCAVAHFF